MRVAAHSRSSDGSSSSASMAEEVAVAMDSMRDEEYEVAMMEMRRFVKKELSSYYADSAPAYGGAASSSASAS